MNRALLFLTSAFLAACSTAGSTTGSTAARPSEWPPGQYELEATVTYASGSSTQADRHTADLTIASDGAMTLNSSSGLCMAPSEAQAAADRSRGQKTFLCGDVRYQLRPGARTVQGLLVTTVNVQQVVTTCAEYGVDKDGNRVCVRTEEHLESRQVEKSARLSTRQIH